MSSVPQTTPNCLSWAFQFGTKDARDNAPFAPECVFVRRQDQINYAFGFESIKGVTEATRQFTGSSLPQPVAKKQHNWGDFNARRIQERSSAHLAFVDAVFEKTLRESGVADLLWLPSNA